MLFIGRSWFSFLGISFLVFLDQLSKYWINKFVPLNHIAFSFLGDWLRIIHVKNLGIAFSLGNTFPNLIRFLLFIIIPIIFIGFLFYISFFRKDIFSKNNRLFYLQKMSLILIIGGGIGNLIDRILRNGVIDFIDVGFCGILGLERWPTFNFADSFVCIGALLWFISSIFFDRKKDETF